MRRSLIVLPRMALAVTLMAAGVQALAQPAGPSQAALDAAKIAQVLGPAQVPLRDQATLQLPPEAIFIPVPAATAVLHSMGAAADDQLLGVVLPQGTGNAVVAVQFVGQGYVKDADARRWKPDGLLKNLQASPPPSAPPAQVTGWAEAPRYDADGRRLQWAVATRIPNAPADGGAGVNFNAYALGREGYVRLNWVTSASQWAQQKAVAQALLAGLEFNDGKKYADFSSGKTAPYGLAVLVGGPGAAAAVSASPAVWLVPLGGLALVLLGVLAVRWWLKRSAAQKAKERRDFQETSQATQFQDTRQGGPFTGELSELPTDRMPLEKSP